MVKIEVGGPDIPVLGSSETSLAMVPANNLATDSTEAHAQTRVNNKPILSPDQIAKEQAYFHRALAGRKVGVFLADLIFRPLKTFTNWAAKLIGSDPPEWAKPGKPGEWFAHHNQIVLEKLPNEEKAPDITLGMIPLDPGEKGIKDESHYVAILQEHEAIYMHDKTHPKRTVVNAEDNIGMKKEDIEEGVEKLHQAVSDKKPIYLHCKSGVGRSATVLAAYLVKHRGMRVDEAIKLVQRDRPTAQLGSLDAETKHTVALRIWADQIPAIKDAKLLYEAMTNSNEPKSISARMTEDQKKKVAVEHQAAISRARKYTWAERFRGDKDSALERIAKVKELDFVGPI